MNAMKGIPRSDFINCLTLLICSSKPTSKCGQTVSGTPSNLKRSDKSKTDSKSVTLARQKLLWTTRFLCWCLIEKKRKRRFCQHCWWHPLIPFTCQLTTYPREDCIAPFLRTHKDLLGDLQRSRVLRIIWFQDIELLKNRCGGWHWHRKWCEALSSGAAVSEIRQSSRK